MPNESNKRWNGFSVVLIIAVLVPNLYVLSVGPAFWLLREGYISFKAWLFVYGDLLAVAKEHKTVGRMYYWYVDLFVGQ